jgi:endonuclease YncB( thermonuclease family)
MKKILVFAILSLIFVLSISLCFGQTPLSYDSIRVIDGDTAELAIKTVKTKVRFLHYDSPELKQDYGEFCKAKLQTFMNVSVTQFFPFGEDFYHRKLVRVYTDELDVNLEMVKIGCGWTFFIGTDSSQYTRELFGKYFEEVHTNGIGLFSNPKAERPRLFRKRKKLSN